MGQKVYCLRLLVKSDSYFTSHVYYCVQECEINKQPSLIIHDVILTDQSGVVLEITTQHETEKKQISRNFHWKRNTLGGYILLLPSFSLLIKCSMCYSKNKLSLTIAFQELYPRLEVPHSDKEQELFGLVTRWLQGSKANLAHCSYKDYIADCNHLHDAGAVCREGVLDPQPRIPCQ